MSARDYPTVVFHADGTASFDSGPIKCGINNPMFFFNFHDDLIQAGLNQLNLDLLQVPSHIRLHANQLPADVFKDTDPSVVIVGLFKTRVIEQLQEFTNGQYHNCVLAPNTAAEGDTVVQRLFFLNYHYWFRSVAAGVDAPLCHVLKSYENERKCTATPLHVLNGHGGNSLFASK